MYVDSAARSRPLGLGPALHHGYKIYDRRNESVAHQRRASDRCGWVSGVGCPLSPTSGSDQASRSVQVCPVIEFIYMDIYAFVSIDRIRSSRCSWMLEILLYIETPMIVHA
jgi:hypothetical protein